MVVTPRKKRPPLGKDELRVINIGPEAVQELLWEHLMEHQAQYLDIDPLDDNSICVMGWGTDGTLTYAVMPIAPVQAGLELDIDRVQKKLGHTTQSVFQPNRYRRLHLTPGLLRKTGRS